MYLLRQAKVTPLRDVRVGLRSSADCPVNVELFITTFQLPYVLQQLCGVLAVLQAKVTHVVGIPLLEGVLSQASVFL